MKGGPVLLLLLGGGALATSFLLSGMEAGVAALNRLRVRHLARQGVPAARLLEQYLTEPERFLWTILVGNTLAGVTVLGLAFERLQAWLGRNPAGLVLAMLATVFLLYQFADLLPKLLFRQFPTRLCLALARPFALVDRALTPVVWPIEALARALLRLTGGHHFPGRLFQNRQELRQLLQESARALSGDEVRMVNRVLDMPNTPAAVVMTPLDRVVCVPPEAPLSEVCRRCADSGHDRLPVRRAEGPIIGVVSLRQVLYREHVDRQQPVKAVAEPALYLPGNVSLEEALRQFQRSGQRLAVVLNPQRKEIGILTLTDVLRFIFGEVTL